MAAAGMLALHTARASADPSGPVVVTDDGPVRGVSSAGTDEFLGIPYAAAPIGTARWRPPAAAQRWHGVLDADHFGSSCPQIATPFGRASESEDCLYLNVYTPAAHEDCDATEHGGPHAGSQARHHSGLPVMVWLHPGAFQYGEGDDFDPTQLVAHGVVAVTLNYRLGSLGFLAHPALSAESEQGSSGNFGLQDQQAALRWVQRNIERFGGDPDNVTIFGQSAGAVSVHAHMVSPQSAGLFQRAIAQSGGYSLLGPTLATAEAEGQAFATAIGCPEQTAACMRAVPVSTLLANQDPSPTAYLPKVDASILPTTIATAFATGQFNRVPVIEGSTHDEFRLFVATSFVFKGIPVTAATYPSLVAAVLNVPAPVAQTIVNYYYPLAAYPSAAVALGAIGTDAAFACNTRLAAGLLAQYVPVWVYEFDDPDAPQVFLPPAGFPYGAYHGSEVQYLGAVHQNVPTPGLTADQRALAGAMQSYWTTFARSSDPNSPDVPAWTQYQPLSAGSLQLLTAPAPEPYSIATFAVDHKCALWSPQ